MAVLVATDVRVEFNSVVISDHCTEASIPVESDEVETTAFGSTWKTRLSGLKDGKVELKLNQDYASGSVDATFWAAFAAGTNVTVKLRPTSSSISATNPEYSVSVVPTQHTPVAGSVGELSTFDVSFPTSGAVSRATS